MKSKSETHAKRLKIFHQERFSFTPQKKKKHGKEGEKK